MSHEKARGRGRWWILLLSKFLGVNVFVQVAGLIAGILVVRELPKTDYGYYSILTAMLAAFILVTDSGVVGVVIAKTIPVMDHPLQVDTVYSTAIRVQRRVAWLIGAVSVVLICLLLAQMNAPAVVIVIMAIALLASSMPLTYKALYQAYHRAFANYSRLRQVSLVSAIVRTALIVILAVISALNLYVLILLNVLVSLLELVLVRRGLTGVLDTKAQDDPELRRSLLATIRRTMPMSLTLVAQSQLLLFMLGIFGGSEVLAEVAALSRIATVLAVFGPLISDVGTGVVAREVISRRRLLVKFLIILGAFAFIGLAVVLLLALCARWLTALLGPQYAGLEGPMIVIALGTVGILLSDAFRVLNQARGWTRHSWIYIPISLLWALLGIFVFDLKDVYQASIWMALQAGVGSVTQLVVFASGIRSENLGDSIRGE